MVRIGQASIDENGHAHGGQAGNQNGKELNIKNWYSSPWNVMLRHPNRDIANKASDIIQKLINSKLVGYDQYERNTLHDSLKKYNYDVDKYIQSGELTECDCSSLVSICYIAAGVKTLEYTSNAPATSNMRKTFEKAGFEVYTNSRYLKSSDYLKVGDVLVKEGSHTVMALDDGDNVKDNEVVYYPQYDGSSVRIDDIFRAIGVPEQYMGTYTKRKPIAQANGIKDYRGTMEQNTELCNLAREGQLKAI